MKIGQPQASWYLLLAQNPDLHLTVGDTHYADTTAPKVQWEHHLRYRRQKEFATVLRNVPTYAMWDDHDYGPEQLGWHRQGEGKFTRRLEAILGQPRSGHQRNPGRILHIQPRRCRFFRRGQPLPPLAGQGT